MFLKDDSIFDLLISQTFSFEKYIRRSKDISTEKSHAYLNFIKHTRRIANGVIDQNVSQELIKAIKESTALTYKNWLLEKARQASGK